MPRIFLVDDELEMTQLIGALLRMKGFEVESANDPHKALDRLMSEDFDAAIVDLMMPGLDGFSLIASVRSSPKGKIPIVVLSARNLDDGERKSLMESGARYVVKPVSPNKLVEIVKRLLEPQAQ
jgi:DNA-binding response OmpR family regulator